MSTPDSIKTQIQNLISTANTTTGKSDTDLTAAITSLISGYGGGDVTYNGLRYSEGTFYKDTDAMPFTIQHSCGFIPEIFILYPKFEVTVGSANEEVGFVGYYGDLFGELPNQRCGFLLENRTTYTETCTWQLASTWKTISNVLINEEVIVVPYRSASYPFKNGVEYGWIAIAEKGIQSSVIDIAPLINGVTFSSEALLNHYEDMNLNLENATSISAMFDNKPIMFEKLTINISEKCTTFQNAFRSASVTDPLLHNLKTIVINGSTSGVTTFYSTFKGRFETEEILGTLDFSNCTTVQDMFYNCKVLRELRFAEKTLGLSITMTSCGNLSDESIQSIIDGLATVETAQTLTFHEDIKSKLTEEQISTITSKNWTLA